MFGIFEDRPVSCEEIVPLIHPEDRARVEGQTLAALDPQGKGLYEAEYRIIRSDGMLRWVCIRGSAIAPGEGAGFKIERFIGTAMDITHRKIGEEKLRESEERLKLAGEATRYGTFDFYPQTGELVWSSCTRQHFGLSLDADVDYNVFLKGLHPEDRDRVDRIVQDVMRPESGGLYQTEYRTIGIEDGVERWLSLRQNRCK